MIRRPIVLAAILVFLQTSFVLAFPDYFTAALVADIVLVGIFIIYSAKAKNYLVLIVFIPAIILSSLVPHLKYLKYEKPSYELVELVKDKENVQYCALVEECRVYSSYARIIVTIRAVSGKPLETPLRARLGCYAGYGFEEGSLLFFEGEPVKVCDIETDTFNTKSYLRSKEIFIDFPSVTLISSTIGTPESHLSKLRSHTSHIIYRHVSQHHNTDTSAVCNAMFSGDKDNIPDEISDWFSECGLTHILCVSGMHLAILSGVCYNLLTLLTLHKKPRCIIVILICIFYTFFTGLSLSTIRSCIMCCVSYIGLMTGRKTDSYLSLFFSFLVICIFSPYSTMDISLLLSFCATLGIICFTDLDRIYTGKNIVLRALCPIKSAFLSNLGAVIFTLPVCAVSFGGVSTMSVISTLSVSFIFEALLMLLLMLILLSPLGFLGFFEAILDFIGKTCNILCTAIIDIAEFFARFRYAKVTCAFPQAFIIIFVVLIILLAIFIAFGKTRALRICICATAVLGIVLSSLSLAQTIADDKLYKVFYYRKNEDNRQISIKLETQGYLLIDADCSLCNDADDLPFDKKTGQNYLLLIPDDDELLHALKVNIGIFDRFHGLQKVFVPKTDDGTKLAGFLVQNGIEVHYIPENLKIGNTNLTFNFEDRFSVCIDDGTVRTSVVFADSYDKAYFDDKSDICAFFTRKTKNQFNPETDTKPVCDTFVTRLKKDEVQSGIVNTYGEKSVIIKG